MCNSADPAPHTSTETLQTVDTHPRYIAAAGHRLTKVATWLPSGFHPLRSHAKFTRAVSYTPVRSFCAVTDIKLLFYLFFYPFLSFYLSLLSLPLFPLLPPSFFPLYPPSELPFITMFLPHFLFLLVRLILRHLPCVVFLSLHLYIHLPEQCSCTSSPPYVLMA